MTTSAPRSETPPHRRSLGRPPVPWTTWRLVAVAVVVSSVALTYVGSVVVPYVVNGLHELPLAEVASGAHDPKDLPWPSGAAAGTTQLLAFASIALTPWCAGLGALVVGVDVWDARRAGRAWTALRPALLVLALCVVVLVAYLTPAAGALTTWRMD